MAPGGRGAPVTMVQFQRFPQVAYRQRKAKVIATFDDKRINTYDFALFIYQGTATIARVDGCIYLYVFNPVPYPVYFRNHALGSSIIEPVRMPDRHYYFTVVQGIIITQLYFRQLDIFQWLQKSKIMLFVT